MGTSRPHTRREVSVPHVPPLACTLATIGCVAALAGCGRPPELNPQPGTPVPRPPATATPTPSRPVTATAPLPAADTTAPTFGEAYAVSCAGHPSGDAVIALLRRTAGLLSASVRATIRTGPLCAGTWQYTVVAVTGREPLAAVTRGRPGALRLVTAGTDVCSIPVRTEAPAGIRYAAGCS
jgi:hypothetical protein